MSARLAELLQKIKDEREAMRVALGELDAAQDDLRAQRLASRDELAREDGGLPDDFAD